MWMAKLKPQITGK